MIEDDYDDDFVSDFGLNGKSASPVSLHYTAFVDEKPSGVGNTRKDSSEYVGHERKNTGKLPALGIADEAIATNQRSSRSGLFKIAPP